MTPQIERSTFRRATSSVSLRLTSQGELAGFRLIYCAMGLLAVALMAIGFISTTFARKATPPQGKLPQLSAPALAGSLAATVPRTPGNDKPVMKFGGKIVIEPGRTASISDPIAGQLLAAADFDNDGMPDLVCLQSGSFPSSKRLVMRFGNVDAIHPNADGARLRKANDTFTGLPFLSLAKNWTVPLSSKVVFVGAGDFDADGNSDVVITGQGEEQFLFLRGDGSGNLADPEKISIDGRVTAFATGEVNRYDGLMDIVVGAETKNGPKVLVFECPKGALRGMPEVIDITNAPTAIAIGQLDQEFPIDVAVANGSDLTIIWGRDRKLSLAPEIRTAVLPAIQKTVHQDAKLISVVIGAFDGDKVSDGIAISDEAGKVQVWGSINDEHRAEWRLPSSVVSGLSAIRLAAGRVTSLPQDSVLVNDTGTKQIQVLTLTGPEGSKFLEVQRMGGTNAAATVLPMKLNVDGLEDVLFASSANNEVASFLTLPGQVYFVSSIEGDNGNGTLPSAVAAANANPGLDTIVFNIPTNNGRAVIKIQTTLTITDPVVIDGTTQALYTNGDPWITVRCVSTIPGAIGVEIASGNTVLKGLKFSDADFYALRLSGGGANSIVSNVFSADTNAGDPANSLPLLIGSNGNTIGGPSPIDKNSFLGNQEGVWVLAGGPNTVWGNDILSASEDGGILAFGTNTNLLIKDNLISDNAAISVGGAGIQVVNGFATTIQGNKIGTNSAGNAALGVQNNGIHMIGGSNHLIGGPSPAARNIISGNIQSGIRLVTDASTIQNNYIGLSVNGLNSIPNDMGVTISNFARSQFANEATGTRRALGRNFVGVDSGDLTVSNYISGNSHFGIFFDNDWYGALTYVQGNVIGLTRSGGGGQGNGGSKTGTGGGVGGIVSTGTVKVGGSTSSPNVISANRGNGVYLSGPNVRGFDISNNYIGTDPLGGNGNVGNQLNGIRIEAFSGAHTAKANRIAYNGGNGINIDLDSSNLFQGHSTAISGNEIFNNGCAACVPFNDSGSFNVGTLIGIDVGDNGTSTNNPGDGIQDYPVVTSAAVAGNIVTVNGTFSSSTDNYELQFFLTATPCVNNISQSLSFFIGSKLDRFGTFTSFSYQFPMPTGITGGYVQATAINRHLRIFRYQPTELLKRPQGNSSSEYSPCVAAN